MPGSDRLAKETGKKKGGSRRSRPCLARDDFDYSKSIFTPKRK